MPSTSDTEPFKSIRTHDEYYLTGGDLFFLVEQCQFRVHRYFFERESKFFQSKLAGPASPGNHQKQGASESTSIILEDVKAHDFSRFLWVFYNPKYSIYNASVDDWTAILALAHRWGFLEVKKLCVRELEQLKMSDVDRIVTYHNYDIDRGLLVRSYSAVCTRELPLSLDEGMRLGMETTLNIARARETARAAPTLEGIRSPSMANIELQELGGIIKNLFGIPIVEEPAPINVTAEPAPAPANGTTGSKINGGEPNGSTNTTAPPPPPPVVTSDPNDTPTRSALFSPDQGPEPALNTSVFGDGGEPNSPSGRQTPTTGKNKAGKKKGGASAWGF